MLPASSSGALIRGTRAGTIVLAMAAACLAPTFAAGATQDELEAKVDALAKQVQALQAELAEMRKERAAANAPVGTGPAVAAGNSASALPNSALPDTNSAGNAARAQASDQSSSALPSYASAERTPGSLSWWGYGELNYSRPTADTSATSADLARFVLGAGYQFDDKTRMNSELEVEHAVSSADDRGEVEVEQLYIEHELRQGMFARAGLILIPSGTLNESHEPTHYYGVFRNFVETAIIPSTWREGGLALQGFTSGGLRWDVGVTTGFDLSKWDATSTEGQESPLGSIHQELQLAHARDLSGFGAVNYTGIPALRIGASLFGGGASQGQPGLPSAGVTLWEGHAQWTPGAWDLAALYAHGHISGTRQINLTLVGNQTLVPEDFFGWYLQAAYRIIDRERWSLAPFLRYERFNTGSSYANIGAGFTPGALPDHKVWTTGFNWTIAPGVVVKADYLNFQGTGDSNRFDLGLGYAF